MSYKQDSLFKNQKNTISIQLQQIESACYTIAHYLSRNLSSGKHFSIRSFYGETFAMLLWSYWPDEFKKSISDALHSYSMKKKDDPEFHWEFNNYALFHYRKHTGDQRVDQFLRPLRFKKTEVTNWTLLRSAAHFLARQQRIKGLFELINKIYRYQLPSGQILDDKNVKSFQYHCFSAALLAELSTYAALGWLRRPFLRAVDFIRQFVMPSGDTLYVGRGQQQSFGYATLLYILAASYHMTHRPCYLTDFVCVWDYISKFQRQDGSYPLVFNGLEKEIPEVVDPKDTDYLGWYAYNNYFDYLPFFAVYLARTKEILEKESLTDIELQREQLGDYTDNNYLVIRRKYYTAILAVPGGYWTNDLPFPYVYKNGQSVFPCYGGEQFQPSLYEIEGIPLPWGVKDQKSVYFRKVLKYRFVGNTLVGTGSVGEHRRIFSFHNNGFDIIDSIQLVDESLFDVFYPLHYLFFDAVPLDEQTFNISYGTQNIRIRLSMPCTISDKVYYCAMGKLYALQHKVIRGDLKKTWSITMKVSWS